MATHDGAVDRDPLARADADEITDRNLGHTNLDLLIVADHASHVWLQIEQPLYSLRAARFDDQREPL